MILVLTFLPVFAYCLKRQRVVLQWPEDRVQQARKASIEILATQRQPVLLSNPTLPHDAAVTQDPEVVSHR
ncbi:hypothetical protein [Xenorhabdus poinarii]|uniref:hypothetical protein n=1 Tax=Xenorhabdus poinarii TaxID=40577 RepID=UPI0015694C6C